MWWMCLAFLLSTPADAARAKVKVKGSVKAPDGVRILVTPPNWVGGLGKTVGEAAGMEGVGEALDQAAGSAMSGRGHKRNARLQEAFADRIPNPDFVVRSGEAAIVEMDCDYRLALVEKGQGSSLNPLNAYKASFRWYEKMLGVNAVRGHWVLSRCSDDETVAKGKMTYAKVRRVYLYQLRPRIKVKLKDDAMAALRTDHGRPEADRERADYRALLDDIAAWRQAGASVAPGGAAAGIQPRSDRSDGDYAIPVRQDGKVAKWGLQLLGGELAGEAAEQAAVNLASKVGLGNTLGQAGGELAHQLVTDALTKRLPADYYLGSACETSAYIDAAYAHRGDYGHIVSLLARVYPDVAEQYRGCLREQAAARKKTGVRPPR